MPTHSHTSLANKRARPARRRTGRADLRGVHRQNAFLETLSPQCHFGRLFDALDRISFFVKDVEGRLLFANRHLLGLFGFSNESQIIGKTDFELLGVARAEKYRADDRRIMASGKPMLKIIEIFVNQQGLPDWFITNKYPLLDKADRVIGIMGTIQPYEDYKKVLPPHRDIQSVIDYVQEHYTEHIVISDLAVEAKLSVRDLERKFNQHFNMTPQQYVIKLRIHKACELIGKGPINLSTAALRLGFYDQSALTRHFKKVMGMTPTQYRRQYL